MLTVSVEWDVDQRPPAFGEDGNDPDSLEYTYAV
jgi:hypothetical protein